MLLIFIHFVGQIFPDFKTFTVVISFIANVDSTNFSFILSLKHWKQTRQYFSLMLTLHSRASQLAGLWENITPPFFLWSFFFLKRKESGQYFTLTFALYSLDIPGHYTLPASKKTYHHLFFLRIHVFVEWKHSRRWFALTPPLLSLGFPGALHFPAY